MNESLITDPRPLEAFKDKSFSDFKKRDVYSALIKSIETRKIENACYWITECLVSGYTLDIIEKLLLFHSKIIHINSPNLPLYLNRKYVTFLKSIDHLAKKEKHKHIHFRNTQTIRNYCFDLVVILCLSAKNKRYDKYPKINPDTDFQFTTIKDKMNATMQVLPSSIIRFTDPEELRIILNELFFNLKNELGGYDKSCYWVAWILQWEKKNKKDKKCFEIEDRKIQNVHPKYCKDVIWIIWEVIIEETKLRNNTIQDQIFSLYSLFKLNFTSGKKNSRLPYLYHSIGYLTLPIQWKTPIINDTDYHLLVQSGCNCHKMFKNKKEKEVKEYIPPPTKPKKKIDISVEISSDKMNVFREIDIHN
jgi:hypothetical protein